MHDLKTGDISGQTCRVFTMSNGDWYLEIGLAPQVANDGDHKLAIVEAQVRLRWTPGAQVDMRERQWFSVGGDLKVEGGYSLTGKALEPGSRLLTDYAWFQSNTFGAQHKSPGAGTTIQGTLVLQPSKGAKLVTRAFSVIAREGVISDEV